MRKIHLMIIFSGMMMVTACKSRSKRLLNASNVKNYGLIPDDPISFGFDDFSSAVSNSQEVKEIVPVLIEKFRENFTVAIDSSSGQGTNRVIFFNWDGSLILTVSPESNEIHGVRTHSNGSMEEAPSDVIPFLYEPTKGIRDKPAECQQCHDRDLDDKNYEFVYRWDSYPTWKGFLGENHDLPSRQLYSKTRKYFEESDGYGQLFINKISKKVYADLQQYPFLNSRNDFASVEVQPNLRLSVVLGMMQAEFIWWDLTRNISAFKIAEPFMTWQALGCSEYFSNSLQFGALLKKTLQTTDVFSPAYVSRKSGVLVKNEDSLLSHVSFSDGISRVSTYVHVKFLEYLEKKLKLKINRNDNYLLNHSLHSIKNTHRHGTKNIDEKDRNIHCSALFKNFGF